jgi:hypothetical protein
MIKYSLQLIIIIYLFGCTSTSSKLCKEISVEQSFVNLLQLKEDTFRLDGMHNIDFGKRINFLMKPFLWQKNGKGFIVFFGKKDSLLFFNLDHSTSDFSLPIAPLNPNDFYYSYYSKDTLSIFSKGNKKLTQYVFDIDKIQYSKVIELKNILSQKEFELNIFINTPDFIVKNNCLYLPILNAKLPKNRFLDSHFFMKLDLKTSNMEKFLPVEPCLVNDTVLDYEVSLLLKEADKSVYVLFSRINKLCKLNLETLTISSEILSPTSKPFYTFSEKSESLALFNKCSLLNEQNQSLVVTDDFIVFFKKESRLTIKDSIKYNMVIYDRLFNLKCYKTIDYQPTNYTFFLGGNKFLICDSKRVFHQYEIN